MKVRLTRRDFLGSISSIGLSSILPTTCSPRKGGVMQPRKGKGNLYRKDGKSLLVVVEGHDVEKMLSKGLDCLGGLDRIVERGESTFIKPNYGSHRDYPTGSDPRFLIFIANRLKQSGAGEVTICDSSDGYVLNRYNDFAYVFKTNNVFDIGKEAGVNVICTHPIEENDYVSVASHRWQKHREMKVNKHLLSTPIMINQPMLKKHGDAFMTCALKNFFGAVHQPQRLMAHQRLREGDEEGRDFFMKTIAEFADTMRPELTIVDARKIMTIRGPSLKEGSKVIDVNKLILSGDMVATDAYCARLLDDYDETFDKVMVQPTLEYARDLGLGVMDFNKIEVIEETV